MNVLQYLLEYIHFEVINANYHLLRVGRGERLKGNGLNKGNKLSLLCVEKRLSRSTELGQADKKKRERRFHLMTL